MTVGCTPRTRGNRSVDIRSLEPRGAHAERVYPYKRLVSQQGLMGPGLSPGASDLPGDLAYLLQVPVVSESDNRRKLLISYSTLLAPSPLLLLVVFQSAVGTLLPPARVSLPVGAVCPWTASSWSPHPFCCQQLNQWRGPPRPARSAHTPVISPFPTQRLALTHGWELTWRWSSGTEPGPADCLVNLNA